MYMMARESKRRHPADTKLHHNFIHVLALEAVVFYPTPTEFDKR